jgi:hypothetical protein
MKLTKQKKERIEGYIDMLQFNGDMMSYFNTEAVIPILTTIITTEKYYKNDKPVLELLEKRYHKNKIVWS